MKTLKGITTLTVIAWMLITTVALKAQCNLTATSSQTNVSCNGGNNGSIIVKATGGTGPLLYGAAGTGVVMATEQFNSNVTTVDTNFPGYWYTPNYHTALTYHANGGCTTGMVSYSGSNTDYWGNFIRTPQQNCAGNSSVTMSFDLSNSYIPSHIDTAVAGEITSDGMRFYMWASSIRSPAGAYFYASSIKINGKEVSVNEGENGLYLLFDTLRTCVEVDVSFNLDTDINYNFVSDPLDTITNLSGIYFYLEADDPYNDANTFSVMLDNIGITGNPPSSWQANDTFPNLAAGVYNIDVKDSVGCATSVTNTITQPAPVSIRINSTDYGNCTDTATAVVSGGIPPYILQWSDAANQVGLSETHVCQDTLYFVNVTDANGCMAIDSIIGGGLAVVINATTSVNCFGLICNGSANAQVTGGYPPYTYKWSNDSTTESISNLCIGNYSLTVKDATGDSIIKSFTIDTTPQVSITVTTQPNSGCSGICNGAVIITVHNGDGGPYRFKWSDEVPLTNGGSRTGLCTGSYTVSAIDEGLCYSDTVVANFTINQASALAETLTAYSSCNGGNGGSIIANASNGTAELLYSISPGQAIGMETFDNSSSLVTIDSSVYSSWFSPGTCTGGGMTWQSTGGCNGGSGSGTIGYTASPGTGNGCFLRSPLVNCTGHSLITMTFDMTNTASPFNDSIRFYVYSVVNNSYYTSLFTYVDGVSASKISFVTTRNCDSMNVVFDIATIPIADRSALYFYLQPTFQEASGYSFNLLFDNISISDTVPLYLWQPGNTFTNLSPGAYTVSVMDTSGCFASVTDTVGSAGNFTVTASSNSPVCAGDTIRLYSTASLGATYSWLGPIGNIYTSPAVIPDAVSSDAGTYTVSAVSDSGCLATASVNVAVDQMKDTVSGNNATCDGICNGEVQVVSVWQGGVPPFTYSWNNGAYSSVPIDSGICAGTYHVIIRDSQGCTKTDSVTITSLVSCDVWPGDANDDGVVNNDDILEIGLGYGYTGPVRDSASLVWEGQPATDWDSVLPPGINAKFADCDGNGIINADDTLAVTLNYSLTHPKTSGSRNNNGPLLYIQLPPQDSVEAGQTVQVPLYLGTESDPVDAISGLAFSISYNNTLVDSIVQLSASGSWMGTPGSNLLTFRENLYTSGITDIAITRTDHSNVSGYGPLCTLSYVMKDDISGKTEISKILPFNISNVTGITSKGVAVPLSYGGVDTVVAYQYTGISNISLSSSLRVYPNPAGQYIIADAGKVIVDQYIITDLLGSEQKVIDVKQQGPLKMDISQLDAGMYFLHARSGVETTTLKFSVVR